MVAMVNLNGLKVRTWQNPLRWYPYPFTRRFVPGPARFFNSANHPDIWCHSSGRLTRLRPRHPSAHDQG